MATKRDLTPGELFAGVDHSLVFDVVDSAGAAQTMTGWALKFVLRRLDGTLVFEKTTVSGITIGNGVGTDDRATVAVADTDTLGWPGGWDYKYTLWRTDAGSDVPLTYSLRSYMTEVAAQ